MRRGPIGHQHAPSAVDNNIRGWHPSRCTNSTGWIRAIVAPSQCVKTGNKHNLFGYLYKVTVKGFPLQRVAAARGIKGTTTIEPLRMGFFTGLTLILKHLQPRYWLSLGLFLFKQLCVKSFDPICDGNSIFGNSVLPSRLWITNLGQSTQSKVSTFAFSSTFSTE